MSESELAAVRREQRKNDTNHLFLLAIFHFIGAILAFLGILFLLAHYAMLYAVFNNPEMFKGQNQQAPPKEFFVIFKWFYLIIGTLCLASGILNVMSGVCLRARKCRTFSLIVAGINCLHVPLGTILGVFTFVVLMRESVQESYSPTTIEQRPQN